MFSAQTATESSTGRRDSMESPLGLYPRCEGSSPSAGPIGLREMELSEEAAKQLMDVLSKPSTLTIKPANMPCYQPDQHPA